jgi:translation elongation factor P/translation initiation factor 5A
MTTKRIPARDLRAGMSLVIDETRAVAEVISVDNGKSGTWIDVACAGSREFIFHVDEIVTVLVEEYDF